MYQIWNWLVFAFVVSPSSCNRPIFSDDAWIQMLFLPYDTPPGSAIYRVQAHDNEAVPHYPLTFSVSGRGSDMVEVVPVSQTEADIVLRKPLTRGNIYPLALQVTDTANEKNVIEIRVNATERTELANKGLLTFPVNPIVVPENTLPGSEIGSIIAKKRQDTDRYPDLILSKSSKFRLDIVLTSDEAKGRIILTEAIDYETKNYYTLNVTVYRGPYNKLLDNRNILVLPIIIKVEDVQDTNPIFTKLPLLTRMRSDVPAGTKLLKIEAIDGDRSAARLIRYGLKGENSRHFQINENTGDISTANPGYQILRGCEDSAMIINVTAEEINDRSAQSTEEIVIFIEAMTTPKPKFSPDNVKTSIDENAPMLTQLQFPQPLHLTDEGNCALLRVSIQDEGTIKASEIFSVNPPVIVRQADIDIFVKNPQRLDYEEIKEITFRIAAYPDDPKFHSEMSSALITVAIKDVNDNAPIFQRDLYEAKLPESAGEGTHVIQVVATDIDNENNGNIRYTRILGDPQNVFRLDSDSGVITLGQRGMLDREKIDQYKLQIEACDQQGNGNCNTTTVIVRVTDDNDNRPTFDRSHYYACLTPYMRRNQIFFNLRAADRDEPGTPNSFITYEITGGNPNSYFQVNRQGNLSITIDARSIPNNQESQLLIRARDHGNPPQSSETTVHVSADPARCTQQVVEFVVAESEVEIKSKKEQYEQILTELNSGSITKIDQVKAAEGNSRSRIVTSVVQHLNHSTIDLTVWERRFASGSVNVPSVSPEYGTPVVAVAESEAWKWVLIALLILLAIIFIILLCCCLCKPNSKLKTTQVYNKHRNHRDEHHPPRPRHHHRHRQHHATERIRSAPMVNGKTNIPYSRHIPDEVAADTTSTKRLQSSIARNTDTAISQRSTSNPPASLKSSHQPRVVQEMLVNESSGLAEGIAFVSEETAPPTAVALTTIGDGDDNGPHAQLKNQFLEKKSLFTIAYDGMHSKHDLLRDRDYPPNTNTPIS